MTAAQRQRRHRAKVKRQLIVAGKKVEQQRRERRRIKLGEDYIPVPPDITYWREVAVSTPTSPGTVLTPITKPAAAVMLQELYNAEITGLIEVLHRRWDPSCRHGVARSRRRRTLNGRRIMCG